MNRLAVILALLISNAAFANTTECLPISKSPTANDVASKALLNTKDNTVTVLLKGGQSVTGRLVDASAIARGAVGFSEEDTYKTNLNVTVIPSRDGKTYVVISPFMSMGLPQELLCK